jgi:hypothetical protein
MRRTATNGWPDLRFLGVCVVNNEILPKEMVSNRTAWGRVLEVPEKSQVPYGERQGWCSPTCVSMVLSFWAKQLQRSDLAVDVPEVAQGVFDPQWPGTGNWPFNTAYAGRLVGMRAYVTRMNDLTELEEWIKAGVPVPLSISYDLLKGKKEEGESGHVVVCVGFTEQGDVVFNDPWARLDQGQTVRKTFPRHNVIQAWKHSGNTCYLIYPLSASIPKNRFQHWETR